jgi:hypothetical protein
MINTFIAVVLKNYVLPVHQEDTRPVFRDSTNSRTLPVPLVIFPAVADKISLL